MIQEEVNGSVIITLLHCNENDFVKLTVDTRSKNEYSKSNETCKALPIVGSNHLRMNEALRLSKL